MKFLKALQKRLFSSGRVCCTLRLFACRWLLQRPRLWWRQVASGVVSYASSGLVVFEFRLLRMVFSPRWANPVWHLAGWNAADEYEQVLRIARDFAITVPAVNSTWDHILAPPPSATSWCALLSLLRRACFALLAPLRSWWRFFASMWEYGTMHPLALGVMALGFAGLGRSLWSYARCVAVALLRWQTEVEHPEEVRVFFRQLCAANRSIEAGWSSRAALENCHRHLVKMTAMAYLCQMCQAGSPFRISYAGSQQNSVLHGRVSCSARTSASTRHGLGTRCRFHAFADVLSIIVE